MLRLPPIDVARPESLAEALHLLAGDGARPLGGGTDLVPNAKLGQTPLDLAVLTRQLPELHGIEVGDGRLGIGAATRLSELAADESVLIHAPALARAAGRVASPQIRNMATLGGNLCLDTRCRYINQSEFWRMALGGCLKSHGSECHVVPGGQGCVAALSSDTAPVLIAHRAQLTVVKLVLGQIEQRQLPVAELYGSDGTAHVQLARNELIVRVSVPLLPPQVQVGYRKWSVRNSIDFPLVSVALRLERDGDKLADGTAVVSVLGPRPRVLELKRFAGRNLGASLGRDLGQWAFDRCRPLPNVPYDADYRRERLAVEVRRLFAEMTAPLA